MKPGSYNEKELAAIKEMKETLKVFAMKMGFLHQEPVKEFDDSQIKSMNIDFDKGIIETEVHR